MGIIIAFVLSQGFYSYLGASWLGYLFTGLGLYYHSSYLLSIGSFFSSKIGRIIWGLLVGTLITSAIAFSTRFHWRFVLITGIISVIANIIMFIALLEINPSAFSNVLSSFSGISNVTQSVISCAESNGLKFYPVIYATLFASPAVWYYYSWYNVPASWSGEMKKVRLNVFLSIVVAIILPAVYYILFTQLNLDSFEAKFLTYYSYLYYKKCCCVLNITNPLICSLSSIGAFTPFFALLVLGNPILYIIMFIAIWLPNYYSGPPLVVGLSRYLF